MGRTIFIWLFLGWSVLHAEGVSAELSTPTVEAGQAALLSLKVEGGQMDAYPVMPQVKDLIIQSQGQSQQMQIINGRVSRSIQFNYAVGSHVPGEYEIPPISVSLGGTDHRTEPLKLTVRPSSSGAPQGIGENTDAPGESSEYGHLSFQMVKKDRKHLFPGEIAPVRIQAYFPMNARVSLNGPPRPEGSAFTLHHLSDEPKQNVEVVDGRRYRVITWYGGLSATKAGEYPASFTLAATVAVRDPSARQRPSGFDNPLMGGSLLDDLFAPVVEKKVDLKTADPTEIEVRELPAENRPEDFSGAIGKFEFGKVSIPETMMTGEPVRMNVEVKGQGNFSLLQQPEPQPSADWKTYEGKDEFAPGDAASFGGAKHFQFNAVPLTPGERKVSLGFSYFDPDEGEYRKVESVPKEVEITGEAKVEKEEPSQETLVQEPTPDEPKLAPLRTELDSVSGFSPLSREIWFVPAMAGCAAMSLAILAVGVWREKRNDPEMRARREARLAEARALLDAGRAAEQGDVSGFFAAARNALRGRVAAEVGIRPEAVTLRELEGRVDEDVMELWQMADRLDYSGDLQGVGKLSRWDEVLRRGMEALSGGSRAA